MSFFTELKRRNVFRVAIAYAVATWLLLQIVDLVLDNINAPDWVMQVFMLAMAVGFPIAVIIAWAFEVTPEGVKLERNVDRAHSQTRETGQQLNRGIFVIMGVLVVFLLTDDLRESMSTQPGNEPAVAESPVDKNTTNSTEETNKSIAVLPFRDMSAAGDQAYFGEGIAEELLNALVKLDGLHVASRTSTFSLVDEDLDIPAIAQRLGVATILEGSIRTSGKQVRVTAQLIDVNEDVHLWSETYNGSLDDIFKIQDEITAKIIEAMKIQLNGGVVTAVSAGLTDNPEAYQLYLKGRHFWRQRSTESLYEAVRLFKLALELDPDFHRAWSNLAIAYDNLPSYDYSAEFDVYLDLADKAADNALAIAPESSEALTVKADVAFQTCHRVEGIELLEKAITINPNDPTAHHWYALNLSSLGMLEQALKEIQIATRLDPLITAVIATEASIWRAMGDYQQAESLYRSAASLGFEGGSQHSIVMTRILQGDLSTLENLNSPDRLELQTLDQLFADAVRDPANIPAFEQYISEHKNPSYIDAGLYAEPLSAIGSPFLMEYLSAEECFDINSFVWERSFQQARGTPEFFQLMERQGIVDYWRQYGWPDDCASLDQELAECN